MDRTQFIYWQIETLEHLGAMRRAYALEVEAANLHEQRSKRLLVTNDPNGWIDLFAAVTYWGKSGHHVHAHRLLSEAEQAATGLVDGRDNLTTEISRLQSWLRSLNVVPALSDLAVQSLPAMPRMAA